MFWSIFLAQITSLVYSDGSSRLIFFIFCHLKEKIIFFIENKTLYYPITECYVHPCNLALNNEADKLPGDQSGKNSHLPMIFIAMDININIFREAKESVMTRPGIDKVNPKEWIKCS